MEEERESNSFDLYNSFLVNVLNKEFLSDIINVSLSGYDFSGGSNSDDKETIKYVDGFINDLLREIRESQNLEINPIQYKKFLELTKNILKLRGDISTRLISYDNVFNHFSSLDTTSKKWIQEVQRNRIIHRSDFAIKVEEILKTVQLYKTFKQISGPALKKLGALISESIQGGTTLASWTNTFLDSIAEAHSNQSSLKTLIGDNSFSDYMMFGDEVTLDPVVKELVEFLVENYKRYKTGYHIIDDTAGGLETGSVSVISGPSNHAKSIFMINIIKNAIEINKWSEDDAVLMITLEDDKFKLLSRVDAIFGNYRAGFIKDQYEKTGDLVRDNPNLDSAVKEFWKKHYNETIISLTKENSCKLLLKQSTENSFSMNDVNKFINDVQRKEGINIKLVAIDYIDVNIAS